MMTDQNVRMVNPTHRHGTQSDTAPSDDPTVAWSNEFQERPTMIAAWEDAIYLGVGKSIISIDRTGTKLWRINMDDLGNLTGPTVVDGTVYFASENQGVHAVDAVSGEKKWDFETGDKGHSVPAVVDDTVFIGSHDGNVYALNSTTGKKQWIFEKPDARFSMPTVVGTTVFVTSSSSKNGIYALDAKTGSKQWDKIIHKPSSPAVVDGTVFVGSDDNNVYALNAVTGQETWNFEYDASDIGYGRTSAPTVVNNTVFFGGVDHHVYALDAATGTKQWSFKTHGSVSTPAVVDGTVFVGSRDTTVYALNAATGTQQWKFGTDGLGASLPPTVVDNTVFVANPGSDSSRVSDSKNNYVYALNGRAETVSQGSERCSECGFFLSEHDDPRFCPECGTERNTGGKFNTKVYDP